MLLALACFDLHAESSTLVSKVALFGSVEEQATVDLMLQQVLLRPELG